MTVVVLLIVGTARAAEVPESANVRGESTTSRKRLAEAEQKIVAGKSAEAIDDLQRILDEVGDTLVTADGKQFYAARQYVHQFLAKLPDPELKKYRDRVEEPAAKLLALGKSRRETRPLLELLDRYALSRPAEDAILLLAELAFERGQFAMAEGYWKKLLPEAEGYRYPGVKTALPLVRAKIILATQYRGDRQAAGRVLADFQKAEPKAEGHIAGKTGNLSTILAELLSDTPPRLSSPANPADWSSLGGSPSREGRVPGNLHRHWPSQPTWKTPIPPVEGVGKIGASPGSGPVKSLAFHPVVMDGRAYIADAGRVIAFDLRTGTAEVVFDQRSIAKPALGKDTLRLPTATDTDFTLTATGGRLYFRFGSPLLFPVPADVEALVTRPSTLICLARPPESLPDALPTRVAWKRFPPVAGDGPASWEGSPLVVDGHVLAAFVRSEGGRAVQAIACYRDDGERPIWVTDVCEVSTAAGRTRPELLTLAGRNVVFCSHSGVVAAVNLHTGKPAWAYRYPRIRRFPGDGRYRDLSPPVAAAGRVFVAPNDGDQLLAFDAESGKLLWQDGPLLFDHVIGAAAGKVVATVAGPQRGIRAYDAATGSCDGLTGWRNHDDPYLPTFGRGLLSDEVIAWPTATALYTIRLADGTVAAQPVRVPHGNLAYAWNVLLVATATEVWGYVQEGDEPPRESPQPRPILLGAIPPTETVRPIEPKVGLPLRLDSPAVLERVTAANPERAANVGAMARTKDGQRLLVRAGVAGAEFVTSAATLVPYDGVRPTTVVARGGHFLLASDDNVSQVDSVRGRAIWTVTQPDIIEVIPIRNGLVLRVGEHHLVAYELATGRICWALDSHKRSRLPEPAIESGARFLSAVAFEDRLLVQLSTGRRWLIEAAKGHVLKEADTADREWATPPQRLTDGAVVVADGPSRVSAIDTACRVLWSFDAKREASLTGEAAGVRVIGDSVYVFVHRNHGVEVERLSALAGLTRWADRPALLKADADPLTALADDERIYVPTAGQLVAFKLDTGREAWQAELPPAESWQTVLTQNRLVVLPKYAVTANASAVFESFLRFPHMRRVLGLLHTLADDSFRGNVPVLLFDPRTGRLQQRLDIAAVGSVSVDVGGDGVWIAAGGAMYRLH
ncbi:outer membrane protein assembly factor BamB family protein [Limnoglobus roseus]|uniref:outer membrane protein assembly factor BamB family protein n=1 Tax=Limnoglobus roseus TaxID=2598579 RepID=UPI0011EADC31|nr:PQQ-binding-like beta-propeller repeat protein [Limnoglobus roseus]